MQLKFFKHEIKDRLNGLLFESNCSIDLQLNF